MNTESKRTISKNKRFKLILEDISNGLSLRKALKKHKLGSGTFSDIINSSEDNQKQYARAAEKRADCIFEEMFEIADDGTNDFVTKIVNGEEIEVFNKEHVQRSKLRIDARKWALSKMNPKKYGDSLNANLNHSGEITTKQTISIGGKEIEF